MQIQKHNPDVIYNQVVAVEYVAIINSVIAINSN